MEEFYRRKYLSPTFSRTSSYADSLQKDKTVSELRKQLQECKEMEQKFDDLCLDIVKLQRQNKKIQSEQSLIEAEYIEKIKKNKLKITQLKQAVLDCRENIEARAKKVALLEGQNQRLSSEVERLQGQVNKNRADTSTMSETLPTHEGLLQQTRQKIEHSKIKATKLKSECQSRSLTLQRTYEELKEGQLKLRQQETNNEQLRRRLEVLSNERQLWQKKTMVSEADLEDIVKQASKAKESLQDKQNFYKEAKQNSQSCSVSYASNKKDLKRIFQGNNQKALMLSQAQAELFKAVKQLHKEQSYYQKMGLKQAELRKDNQRLRETLKQVNELVTEEQEAYSRVIAHMKQSIQQDEKAIEGLVKQASLIENMIS